MRVPRSFASACVTFLAVGRYFISARTVIVASVIAVPVAGKNPAACSAARPTAVTNKVPRAVSITGIASASIGSGNAPT